jgi:DivIVA domain-containing protein
MDGDDDEKRIADLDRQLAEARASGDPRAGQDPQRSAPVADGWLTPDQIRNVAFSSPPIGQRGYNEQEVDALLDAIEAAVRDPTGHPLTAEQIRNVAFSKPPLGKRGYREDDVDAFLSRVEQQLRAHQGDSAAYPPPVGAADIPVAIRPQPGSLYQFGVVQRRGRARRIVSTLIGIVGLAAALALAGVAAYDFYGYLLGAPTTATIHQCETWRCTGTWSVNGRPYDGSVAFDLHTLDGTNTIFRHYSPGSTVDVRVHGGTAFTKNAGFVVLVFAVVFAAGAVFGSFPDWLSRRPKWLRTLAELFGTNRSF